MTHALSTAVERRYAQAHHDAEAAIELAAERPDVDRPQRVAHVAVELLHEHGPDRAGDSFTRYALERFAWMAAELAVRADVHQAAEPEWPPAAADIRLASDFPDNQPLGGRHG